VEFIQKMVRSAGRDGVTLGVSGGIDSAVCAALGVEALGAERVHPLILPYGGSDRRHVKDAIRVCELLRLKYNVIDIKPACDSIIALTCKGSRVDAGNIRARVRMIILYHEARCKNLLVMGTGNKSEILIGYFTKYGDGGADLMPIGDLYKTEVRELANELKLPEWIIRKTPTAGLWSGQTDEDEIGMKYEKLDRVLCGIEHDLSDEEIMRIASVSREEILRIREMVERSAHKRMVPRIPKVGYRTVGIDWRE